MELSGQKLEGHDKPLLPCGPKDRTPLALVTLCNFLVIEIERHDEQEEQARRAENYMIPCHRLISLATVRIRRPVRTHNTGLRYEPR